MLVRKEGHKDLTSNVLRNITVLIVITYLIMGMNLNMKNKYKKTVFIGPDNTEATNATHITTGTKGNTTTTT